MVDFISLEEAAEQLDIPDSLLRQWVKKGLARASRRGGSYVLRTTEVERLRRNPAPDSSMEQRLEPSQESRGVARNEAGGHWPQYLGKKTDGSDDESGEEQRPSEEGGIAVNNESAPRPRALPPRSREDEAWPVKDRRKKMGRRGSDFSLEALHGEVRSAVEGALEAFDERLALFTKDLHKSLREHDETTNHQQNRQLDHLNRLDELTQNLAGLAAPPPAVAVVPDPVVPDQSAEVDELKQRLQHLEDVREDFRRRLEESEKRRLQSEEKYQSKTNEQESALRQVVEHEEVVRHLEDAVQRERARVDDIEATLQKNQEALRATRAENDRLQATLQQTSGQSSLIEQERARQLEVLTDELNQLRELTQRTEESRSILEDQLHHTGQKLEQTQNRAEELESERDAQNARLTQLETIQKTQSQREEELTAEVRRWKEQVNSLQFKVQMQGQGGSTATVEESRKLMERLAEMEAQMHEKDRLISQSYRELSELRSKLEEGQRVFYELQQRTEKEKEEWSQLVAQQLHVTGELNNQRQQREQAQSPPPQEKGRWGLFKLRGDT